MEPKQQRQLVVLTALLAALVAVVAWQLGSWPGDAGAPSPAPSAEARRPRAAGSQGGAEMLPVKVALDQLGQSRPSVERSTRNPFRTAAAAAAPSPEVAPPPVQAPAPSEVEGPPPEPPPPPIALRFIGLLVKGASERVAVLSDGRFVYHGKDGDIIDGRYRLVSVEDDAVEMEHLDGRGRQRIRLSGA